MRFYFFATKHKAQLTITTNKTKVLNVKYKPKGFPFVITSSSAFNNTKLTPETTHNCFKIEASKSHGPPKAGSMKSNAFTNPSSGKIDQQRKILEELEKRKNKKQLNQGGAAPATTSSTTTAGPQSNPSSSSTTSATGNSHSNSSGSNNASGSGQQPTLVTPDLHLLSSNQRSALEQANKNSFGYYIPQDSSFGNLILPVIPRFE